MEHNKEGMPGRNKATAGIYNERLYSELARRGFPDDFCRIVAQELRMEFTAKRMLGYLREYPNAPITEIVDEMLAIASDRDEWIKKKQAEHAQQTVNELYRGKYYE